MALIFGVRFLKHRFGYIAEKIVIKHRADTPEQVRVYIAAAENVIDIPAVAVKAVSKPCDRVLLGLAVKLIADKFSNVEWHCGRMLSGDTMRNVGFGSDYCH